MSSAIDRLIVDEHLPSEGIREHGHLSREESDAAIDAAVRDVVLPGFELLGMVTPRADAKTRT